MRTELNDGTTKMLDEKEVMKLTGDEDALNKLKTIELNKGAKPVAIMPKPTTANPVSTNKAASSQEARK